MSDSICRASAEDLEYDRRQSEERKPSPEDYADFHYDEWREMQDEQ